MLMIYLLLILYNLFNLRWSFDILGRDIFLTGDFNGWNTYSHKLYNIGNGIWEIFIPGQNTLYNGCYVKTIIRNGMRWMHRIPLYIKRVMQEFKHITRA